MNDLSKSRLRQIENRFIITVFFISVCVITLLIIAKWPRYWEYIASEQTPMTWFESLILFSIGMTAAGCAALSFMQEGWKRRARIWAVLAGSFLFLTLDERFAIHERIRDGWLKPANIKIPLPWVDPGDFLLIFYLIFGILMMASIYRLFKVRKSAWIWFSAAALIAAFTVVMDSFGVTEMTKDQERFEQTLEEIIETMAMLCFWVSFVLMGSKYLQDLVTSNTR